MSRTKTVTTVRGSRQDYLTFEKPPARVVFSFTGQEITRGKKDLKKILYKLDIQPHKEEYLNHLGICIGRITSHISLLPA